MRGLYRLAAALWCGVTPVDTSRQVSRHVVQHCGAGVTAGLRSSDFVTRKQSLSIATPNKRTLVSLPPDRWFSRVNDSFKSEDLTTVSNQVVYGQGQQRAATTALGAGDKKSKKKKKQASPSRGSPTATAAGFNNKKIDRVDKRHRRTFLQLGLVVASFMIGYIPTSAYLMWTSVTENKSIEEDYWFGVGSYLCLRFSECLNPLMYNLGSNKLRKATAKFIVRLYRRTFQSK